MNDREARHTLLQAMICYDWGRKEEGRRFLIQICRYHIKEGASLGDKPSHKKVGEDASVASANG